MTWLWRQIKQLPMWAWYGLASLAALLLVLTGLRSVARRLLPSRWSGGSGTVPLPDTVEILSPKAAAERREDIRRELVEHTEVIDDRFDAEIADMENWLAEETTEPDSDEVKP